MKIVATGLIGVVIALTLKTRNPEIALLISIATALFIAFSAMEFFSPIRRFLDGLIDMSGLSPEIFTPLIKVAGISVIAKISAELCRDARELAAASIIEISGAMAAIYVILPLLSSVLKLVTGLL